MYDELLNIGKYSLVVLIKILIFATNIYFYSIFNPILLLAYTFLCFIYAIYYWYLLKKVNDPTFLVLFIEGVCFYIKTIKQSFGDFRYNLWFANSFLSLLLSLWFTYKIQEKKKPRANQVVPIFKLKLHKCEEDCQCQCSICLEELKNKEVEDLECKHEFHKQCIQRWKEMKKSCPLCRENIV